LAQARLADEQDDLAHALPGLLPALLQQTDLMVAPDQRCQPIGPRLERVGYRRGSGPHSGQRDRPGHALEFAAAEIDAFKMSPDQTVSGLGTNDAAALGSVLEPDHNVRRLPHQ